MSPQFSWDHLKAASNLEKHGVTFEEAASVFRDPLAVIFDDHSHAEDEYRELIIGHSEKHRLLIVSFTEREDRIRLISARTVTKRERKDYEQYRKW